MRKLMLSLPLLTLLATGVLAEIVFNGDAIVRPRIDSKANWGDSLETSDTYVLYRARLNAKADIGGGYYFNGRLGTNNDAYWTGKFGDNIGDDATGTDATARGGISWMELYFGYKSDSYSYQMGLLPLSDFADPALDLHRYPDSPVDLPWVILGRHAATGFVANFAGLNAYLSLDDNVTNSSDDGATTTELKDEKTFGVNYHLGLAGFTFTPLYMTTMADDGSAAPTTYGIGFSGLSISGFDLSAHYYMTKNEADDTTLYDGNLMRFKAAGNGFTLWYDIAQYNEGDPATSYDFSYIWASYEHTLYSGEHGSFSVRPTYRLATKTSEGMDDESRNKMEVTFLMKF
ncbi:MAG: hypothetical protein QGG80_04495 [Candidatus Krumholzibacteria bacterium]|jgi:hypothetical protein|nr:hypothetical protein [Candidatus Krumholzibacteria bacterium]MDP6796519.1 hypothetical protein [Candidatus Krumholzibacteria bacterium]MDP7022106.1 hypothetical protein [Candidatus Krumholzibacteria bacterium]